MDPCERRANITLDAASVPRAPSRAIGSAMQIRGRGTFSVRNTDLGYGFTSIVKVSTMDRGRSIREMLTL